ncbi:SGNH/GDSL hydrolase family protein [Bremerella sp. JC770]|uniref:SGNH/GDSL hydrolase family protein n=1 Tax=Bremerella sp. JC770 TaxID=3232137 RepID=UPI0034573D3B
MKIKKRRLAVVCATGLIAIACAGFYIQYFMMRPIGSGPAGPDVADQPFAETWSNRPVILVGLGDSITAGLGADSPDRTFFQRMVENPSDEFPDMRGKSLSIVLPNLTAKNLAISGSTSREHLHVIEDRMPTHDAEVFGLVVMTSGGNDLIHSYGQRPPKECAMYGATLAEAEPWIASFRERLGTMLDKITASFPGGCEIYLADIYDPTDGVGDAPSVYLPHWPDALAIHGRYNEVIRQCIAARENVYLVPLHETFLGHGSHATQFWRSTYVADDPHYWFYENIEDPNDRGYDAIRRVFLNEIIAHSSLVGANKADAELASPSSPDP